MTKQAFTLLIIKLLHKKFIRHKIEIKYRAKALWAKVKVRYAMTRLIKRRYTKLAKTADIRCVM
jgi:hypothetical protein